MVLKTIGLVGIPTSLGAFAPGQEKAPSALRAAGLVRGLASADVKTVDHGDLPVRRWHPDRANRTAQNAGSVADLVREVARGVKLVLAEDQMPLVLGGDCTIELGTVAGFLESGHDVALVYLDLHPDLNVPTAVPDGALDWMGTAHLLGVDNAVESPVRAGPTAPMLTAERLVLLGYGPTETTAFEREVIEQQGIMAIPVDQVAAAPEAAAAAALAALPESVDSVLVHFDVDIVDFIDLPLSEERIRNRGLTFAQATRALGRLVADDRFASLTITELNPDHGAEDGSTLDTFVRGLVAALADR